MTQFEKKSSTHSSKSSSGKPSWVKQLIRTMKKIDSPLGFPIFVFVFLLIATMVSRANDDKLESYVDESLGQDQRVNIVVLAQDDHEPVQEGYFRSALGANVIHANEAIDLKLAEISEEKAKGEPLSSKEAMSKLISVMTTQEDIEKLVIGSVLMEETHRIARHFILGQPDLSFEQSHPKQAYIDLLEADVIEAIQTKGTNQVLTSLLEDDADVETALSVILNDQTKTALIEEMVGTALKDSHQQIPLDKLTYELLNNKEIEAVLIPAIQQAILNHSEIKGILMGPPLKSAPNRNNQVSQALLTVKADGPRGNFDIPMEQISFKSGSVVMSLKPEREFSPGHYKLDINIYNPITGDSEKVQQEFVWGVLAMNTDQDVYEKHQTAQIDVGVLNNQGYPLCDAEVRLTISAPSGKTEHINVEHTGACTVFDPENRVPDYQTQYRFDEIGTHTLSLSAETADGARSLVSKIEVLPKADIIIKRSAATRLFPTGMAPMEIEIAFNRAFSGVIEERVPGSFIIENPDPDATIETDALQNDLLIRWPVQAKPEEIVRLSYWYDAPNVSPEFYLLGGLALIDDSKETVRQEARSWQIANDALPAPGGVDSNMELWLKADDGVTNTGRGTDATNWADLVAGFNANHVELAASTFPTFLVDDFNGNPYLEWDDDTDRLGFGPLEFNNIPTGDLFIASVYLKEDFLGSQTLFQYSTADEIGGVADEIKMTINGDGSVSSWLDGNDLNTAAPIGADDDLPHILTTSRLANDHSLSFDGETLISEVEGDALITGGCLVLGGNSVGDQCDGFVAANNFQGNIAEFAVYSGSPSALEQLQIHSYLALKYGIHMGNDNDGDGNPEEPIAGGVAEGDYVLSDGTTIAFDLSDNELYTNDITGIARDDDSALSQGASRSSSIESVVTISNGNDPSSPDAFTNNLSSLAWANEGGTANWVGVTTTENISAPANFSLLDRLWRVQENGTVNEVTIELDVEGDFDVPAAVNNYYLVIDTDNDGQLDDESPMQMFDDGTGADRTAFDDIYTVSTIDFDDGERFTFATANATPLSGTVYSDEGITTIANGTAVEILINGVSEGSGTTTAGNYSIVPSNFPSNDDVVTFFLNTGGGANGVMVTRHDGFVPSGYDIYQDFLITRSETITNLTNLDLDTANNGDGDITSVYSDATGANLVMPGISKLLVWTGDTYTPGGTLDLGGGLTIFGTLDAAANDINVEGSVLPTGTFTHNGILTLDGSTDVTIGLLAPREGDVVLSGSASRMVTLRSALDMQTNTLTLSSPNDILSLNGRDLTTNGVFSNEGTVRLQGNETLSIATQDADSGTFEYVGDGALATNTFPLFSAAGPDFYNLVINDMPGVGQDLFQTADDLTVANDLTVSQSILDFVDQNIDIDGTVSIGLNGIISGGTSTISVGGDWLNNGTFDPIASAVTLDPSVNHTLSGDSLFQNLILVDNVDDGTDTVLTIENGSLQRIFESLTLDGLDDDDRVNIVSDAPGTQGTFEFLSASTFTGDFLDIVDSVALDQSTGIGLPVLPENSIDSGNNTAWFEVPEVNFAVNDSIAGEATGSINIDVELSIVPNSVVTIPFNTSILGTTTQGLGNDYTITPAFELTFVPGDTQKTITITINNDGIDEINETVVIDLATPEGAFLGSEITHTLTITDDDPGIGPTAFAEWNGLLTESFNNDGIIQGQFVINLTGETFANAGGTLTSGVDYLISNLPGALSETITINANGDQAIVTISGALANGDHDAQDNVSDLEITFNNSAFTGNNSANVANISKTDLRISFIEGFGTFVGPNKTGPGAADADNDTIPDIDEADNYNFGDGNGDNIPDKDQSNVANIPNDATANTSDSIALASNSNCRLSSFNSGLGLSDPDNNYPLGSVDYIVECNAPGQTVTIDAYFEGTSVDTFTLFKQNGGTVLPVNPANIITGPIPSDVFGTDVIFVQFQIKDGETFLDVDGEVNGFIVDPFGLGTAIMRTTDVNNITNSGGGGGGSSLAFPKDGPTFQTNQDTATNETSEEAPLPPPVSESRFTDIEGHWAEAYIIDLNDKQIIQGYEDGTFRPDQPVTRAELLKLILVAFEYDIQIATEALFPDVGLGEWFTDLVFTGLNENIVEGYPEGIFDPHRFVNRAEASKILALGSKLENPSDENSAALFFSDVNEADWFNGFVSLFFNLEVIQGYDDGTYGPANPLTRAEASKVIAETMELLN